LESEQYLYLTTRGRVTGQPREIEIWFVSYDNRFFVIAEYATSKWVRNIREHPVVSARVAETNVSGRARFIDPAVEPELATRVETLFRAKYGWGQGLIVEITPDQPRPT
jgi:deazaflavin-dependent oxidoreductase (nitroreductase family)